MLTFTPARGTVIRKQWTECWRIVGAQEKLVSCLSLWFFNEHLGGGIILADSAELLRPTRGHTCQGPAIFNVLDGISCHD